VRVIITIDCDNAAFSELAPHNLEAHGPIGALSHEIKRILAEVVADEAVDYLEVGDEIALSDINGNTVGSLEVIE